MRAYDLTLRRSHETRIQPSPVFASRNIFYRTPKHIRVKYHLRAQKRSTQCKRIVVVTRFSEWVLWFIFSIAGYTLDRLVGLAAVRPGQKSSDAHNSPLPCLGRKFPRVRVTVWPSELYTMKFSRARATGVFDPTSKVSRRCNFTRFRGR